MHRSSPAVSPKKILFSPSQIINPNSFLSPNPLSFNLRSHSAHRPGDSPGIPHNLSPSPLPVWYLSLTSAAPTHSIWFLSWAPVVHSLAWPTTCHHSPPQLHPRKTSGYFRISLFFFLTKPSLVSNSALGRFLSPSSLSCPGFASRLRVKSSRYPVVAPLVPFRCLVTNLTSLLLVFYLHLPFRFAIRQIASFQYPFTVSASPIS